MIVEATLNLADNQKVERLVDRMPVTAYRDYFVRQIKPSKTAIFHNGDIYPPDYNQVVAITWASTDKSVTVEDRLMPKQNQYPLDQLASYWLSEMPLGKSLRQHVIDPLRLRGDAVVWRNYEASYDVHQLEPPSRNHRPMSWKNISSRCSGSMNSCLRWPKFSRATMPISSTSLFVTRRRIVDPSWPGRAKKSLPS